MSVGVQIFSFAPRKQMFVSPAGNDSTGDGAAWATAYATIAVARAALNSGSYEGGEIITGGGVFWEYEGVNLEGPSTSAAGHHLIGNGRGNTIIKSARGFDSAQRSYTDLAATFATSSTPLVTSAAHPFTSADTNRTIHVTAGSNWTVGWYTITAVANGIAILDRACGSSASLSSGTAAGNSAGSIVKPGNGSVIEDLSITGTLTNVIQAPIGASFANDHVPALSFVRRVDTYADSDGLLFNSSNVPFRLYAEDCYIYGNWDLVRALWSQDWYILKRCTLRVVGPSASALATGGTDELRPIACSAGRVDFEDGRIIVDNSAARAGTVSYSSYIAGTGQASIINSDVEVIGTVGTWGSAKPAQRR